MYHDHDYVISSTGLQKKWKIQREKRKPKAKSTKTEIDKVVLKHHVTNLNDNVMTHGDREKGSAPSKAVSAPVGGRTSCSFSVASSFNCEYAHEFNQIESTKENRETARTFDVPDLKSVSIKSDQSDCLETQKDNSLKVIGDKSDESHENHENVGCQSQKNVSLSEPLVSNNVNEFEKTCQYSVQPQTANQCQTVSSRGLKQKRLSPNRWRYSSNQPKKKLNRFKWHHTYFEQKFPKREKEATRQILPFATSLSEAYQEQETRDSALEDTLREAPPTVPWKNQERSKDPCLSGAEELGDLQFVEPIPVELLESTPPDETEQHDIDEQLFTELLTEPNEDVIDVDCVFHEIGSIRNCQDDDEGLVMHRDEQSNISADFLPSQLISELKDLKSEDNMETMEMQTTPSYTQQTALPTDHDTSSFFPDVDEDIFSSFFGGNMLMDDFVNQNTLDTILNTMDIDANLHNITSSLSTATDSSYVSPDSLSLVGPLTPHKYPHEVLESTKLIQYPDCYQDGCTSPADSGFSSPETVASPISDVCPWKGDLETHDYQSYFKYTVVPSSVTTSPIKSNAVQELKQSKDQEPQFLNMDDQGHVQSSVERSNSVSSMHDQCLDMMQTDSCTSWSTSETTSDPKNSVPKKITSEKSPVKTSKRIGSRRSSDKGKNPLLWEFIRDILLNPDYCPSLIKWEDRSTGLFRFVQSDVVAAMWGKQKENTNMTYEKLSRAMRYYYNRGILERVDGRRLVYKFGPNSHGWRRRSSESKIQHENAVTSPLSNGFKKVDSAGKTKAWLKSRADSQHQKPKTSFACKNEGSTTDVMLTDNQRQLPSASVLLDRKSRLATA